MKTVIQVWVVLGVFFLAGAAEAQEETKQSSTAYPPVPLADILDSVSKKTGRVFLTDSRVQADVVVGQLKAKDITYSSLLIVLFNNGLAATTIGDITNITPGATARHHLVPIVHEEDDAIADYEWVQRIIKVENGAAGRFVPILRPLLPQMAHLVADPASNSIIMIGRYGNTKRLDAIIKEIDKRTPAQNHD